MKKFILITIALLVGLSGTAQEHSATAQNHIKFKGIELTGTIREFVTQYKTKHPNAKEITCDDPNARILKDTFCGIDGKVVISGIKGTGIVYRVVFVTDSTRFWSDLEFYYTSIYEQLKAKYNIPAVDKQEFTYPFNNSELLKGNESVAVKADKCRYTALWRLFAGDIMITILKDMSVAVWYTDTINSSKYETQKNAQYQDEV